MARERVTLPARPFLYTCDQVAAMISVSDVRFQSVYVWFEGRSPGVHQPDKLIARNISPVNNHPEWRITHREVERWMKYRGFRLVEFGYWA